MEISEHLLKLARVGFGYDIDNADRKALREAAAALTAAEGRIKALSDALEPFDDALGEDDDGYADSLLVTMKYGACTDYSLCVGNLRAARAARKDQPHD